MNPRTNIEKQDFFRQIEQSITEKNGKLYAPFPELTDTKEKEELIKEYFFGTLAEKELKIIYDASAPREDLALFLIYKSGGRLIFEYIAKEGERKNFFILVRDLKFSYPKKQKIDLSTRNDLVDRLQAYREKDKAIVIDRADLLKAEKIPVAGREKRAVFWGVFWDVGIVLLEAILLLVYGLVIHKREDISPTVKRWLLKLAFCGPLIAMGIDYILAYFFKWSHIRVVVRLKYHLREKAMSWSESWYNKKTKELAILGAFFLVLCTLLLLLL